MAHSDELRFSVILDFMLSKNILSLTRSICVSKNKPMFFLIEGLILLLIISSSISVFLKVVFRRLISLDTNFFSIYFSSIILFPCSIT